MARQYSGTLGKVGNCQLAVTCCSTDPQATWPGAVGLYLPQAWAEDSERRRKAHIPDGVPFQTEPDIALGRLDQACTWGVPYRCVVADADYGDNLNFLAGLEAREAAYVVWVRADFRVSMQRRATSAMQRADQLLQSVPRWQGRMVRWRHGSKGWLRKKFVVIRSWRGSGDGRRHVGWRPRKRATRGQAEERKYHWSNLPAATLLEALVGYAHRRDAVEQFHAEATGVVGWGPVLRAAVGGLSPAYRDGHAGRQFSGMARVAPAPHSPRLGSPPPSIFPRGRTGIRNSLPVVHGDVARWSRHQALLWWVTSERFMELCSLRKEQSSIKSETP